MGQPEVVGLVPAAGQATRLGDLPFSKELLPVPVQGDRGTQTEAVCSCLLRAMGTAGIQRVFVVVRPGKWDLIRYLADGSRLGLQLAYVVAGESLGPAHSLERASPFVGSAHVAMGFPDILFTADGAFAALLAKQQASDADVVIGTFPTSPSQSADRVEVGQGGLVLEIDTQPDPADTRPSWCLSLWAPSFTAFLLRYVRSKTARTCAERRRLPVGDILHAAIGEGLQVQAVEVSSRPFLDVGTLDGLAEALRGREW